MHSLILSASQSRSRWCRKTTQDPQGDHSPPRVFSGVESRKCSFQDTAARVAEIGSLFRLLFLEASGKKVGPLLPVTEHQSLLHCVSVAPAGQRVWVGGSALCSLVARPFRVLGTSCSFGICLVLFVALLEWGESDTTMFAMECLVIPRQKSIGQWQLRSVVSFFTLKRPKD